MYEGLQCEQGLPNCTSTDGTRGNPVKGKS